MKKIRQFRVVSGHSKSSAVSLLDRAYTTFCSTLIEAMCLFCTVGELFVQSRRFSPTPPASGALVGTDPFWRSTKRKQTNGAGLRQRMAYDMLKVI